MLIVLPPSETKTSPPDGSAPLDLHGLSFPELSDQRERVLDALDATCRRDDACTLLTLRATLAASVAANLRVRELPTDEAWHVYAGDLYDALGAATLPALARRRAATRVVIASSLWGLLRPIDRIPPYRLPICAHLAGLPELEPAWRPLVGPALADAAGPRGLVVDLRSSSYLALGAPTGLADRTVLLRVRGIRPGVPASGVASKRARGALARHLLESGLDPRAPADLAAALGSWDASLRASRPGALVTLEVTAPLP